MSSDYRDIVIEELADAEALLLERVESLEEDVQSYRLLAQEAIHALHDLARERDRRRERHHRLLDEYALREDCSERRHEHRDVRAACSDRDGARHPGEHSARRPSVHLSLRRALQGTSDDHHVISRAYARLTCGRVQTDLQVTSETAEEGKTRLLEELDLIVAKTWLTGRTSAAALVRKVDAERRTLLLDESDAAFDGEPKTERHCAASRIRGMGDREKARSVSARART